MYKHFLNNPRHTFCGLGAHNWNLTKILFVFQGSHGTGKTGKGPEFEILFPAVKKPGILVLSRGN